MTLTCQCRACAKEFDLRGPGDRPLDQTHDLHVKLTALICEQHAAKPEVIADKVIAPAGAEI